jgi:predicted transcriptional regulator
MVSPIRAVPNLGDVEVTIDGTIVTVDHLRLDNPSLASFLLSHEESERSLALVDLLEFALHVNRLANVSADVKELDSVAKRVEENLQEAGDQAFDDLEKLIRNQADETKPDALITLLKTKFIDRVIEELKPTNPKSPFKDISEQLRLLLEKNAARDAGKEGTKHGRDLNANMDALLQQLATESGDSPLYTNDIPTESGSKVGDEVITIDPTFTNGHDVKTVWEFKAVQKVTVPAALAELNEAMLNRKAQAGVFVLARTTHNASWARFTAHPGRRAIIVVDEDDIDPLLVHYAHIWSRVEAVRSFGAKEATIDFDKLQIAVESAKKALDGLSEVVTGHTGIQRSLEHSVKWISKSQTDLKAEFQQILELSKPSTKGE